MKTMVMAFLFLLPSSLLWAQDTTSTSTSTSSVTSEEPDLSTLGTLKQFLSQFDGSEVEKVVAALPKEYRSNFVLFTEKKGSHAASVKNPRVMVFDNQLSNVITFTAKNEGDHHETLEIFKVNADLTVVPMSLTPAESEREEESMRCFGCHGSNTKDFKKLPIPHMILSGTSKQLRPKDTPVLLHKDNVGELSRLVGLPGALDPEEVAKLSASNFDKFTTILVEKNSQAFLAYLKNHPLFPTIAPLLEGFFRYPFCLEEIAFFISEDKREVREMEYNLKGFGDSPLFALIFFLEYLGFDRGELDRFLLLPPAEKYDPGTASRASLFNRFVAGGGMFKPYSENFDKIPVKNERRPCEELAMASRGEILKLLKSRIKSPPSKNQCSDSGAGVGLGLGLGLGDL